MFAHLNRHLLRGTTIAASLCLVVACSDDDDGGTGPSNDELEQQARPILTNAADAVITATYADLANTAGALLTAVQALETTTDAPNLQTARDAWVATRAPWEQSESFLFGPVDTQGLDPSLDSWPVNVIDLEAVLASAVTLTKEFVDGLEGTLKGFHTIEYLLWGDDGLKTADEITAREIEYLVATTQSLSGDATALVDSWSASGGNYAAEFASAGTGSSVYPSAKAGLQELVNGMLVIADEVGNGKINDPLVQQNATLVESRFSGNSIADFQNNMVSLQRVYTGDKDGDGAGLDEIVAEADAALDARFANEIQAAIDAIGAIPGTFRDAIFDDATAVETAQAAVRVIQQTIEEDIAPLVSGL
jgi:putative iron-regulated protein